MGPHTDTVLSVTGASNPARSTVRSVGLVNSKDIPVINLHKVKFFIIYES